MSINNELARSFGNGFIDCNLKSLEKYNPKFLINDSKREVKILSSIQNELRSCSEFYFSVAFITESGVQSLLGILDELSHKGIKGKIITSQYQNFTQPKALRKLLKYKNIQLRIVTEENFHAKGYIFKHEKTFSFIIGSSNLTQNALSYNKEWNLKLSSLENGAVMQSILREFEYTFNNAVAVTDKWIDEYQKIYSAVERAKKKQNENRDMAEVIPLIRVQPNKMQAEALRHLEGIRRDNKNKAIIISATGTGKTYLSAFDVAKVQPKKFLFIVHRENILRAAVGSFKRILGYDINAGILSGSEKNLDCDYTFATIQTMSRDKTMKNFAPDYFDYIVIDEAHRSGGESYQKILEYFEPEFLLGMTATPERTDGYDIFKAFDYNIAYEIRLSRALEENMLVPFHYFGVTEISVNGEILGDDTDFGSLVCDERIERIIEAAEHYGYYGDRVKGLIFCSRVEEAEELSKKLNSRGYITKALSGKNSEEERELSIKKLEQEERAGGYDYILTVDIFNEGVDIPSINQIIMLRPTQSAIVFVQQLGRGLRKYPYKEYLTVIDFIGNYANNFLVPIALYGDRTYNKDNIRKLLNSGSSMISGCSTVNFDLITKEKIYVAIDTAKLSTLKDLKKDYELMKYRLGRSPLMIDFLEQGGREPYAFVDYSKSYYAFAKRIDDSGHPNLNDFDRGLLSFYSKEILNAKRVEEAVILSILRTRGITTFSEIEGVIKKRFGYEVTEDTIMSAIHNLNGEFLKEQERKKYGIVTNIQVNGFVKSIVINPLFKERITNVDISIYLNDMIRYAFNKFSNTYKGDRFRNGFQLYEKYSRKDVCRILNWDKNEESTIYGYRIKHNTCPIFVTYHKSKDVVESQNYNDYFINSTCFNWMTRSNVRINSGEVTAIKNYQQTGLRIPLFVKKSDGEGTDFYFMGDLEPLEFIETTQNGKPIVNIVFKINDEVEESIYNYFEN